ncbi:MAG: DUF4870 domain-containing protein [Anaerolineales bacterium]|nr:DUF4870 domain-containing protein [Anaerolineales bacterium]
MTQPDVPLSTPRQEDKIMAALAHAAVLLPLMGVVAPIVIWATQKDKSRFVGFQALQAAAYQLSLIVLWFAGVGCYFVSFFGMFLLISGGALMAERSEPLAAGVLGLAFFLPFIIIGIMLLAMVSFVLYGLAAAVMVLQGRPFRYLLIAGWLERYLAQQPSAAEG